MPTPAQRLQKMERQARRNAKEIAAQKKRIKKLETKDKDLEKRVAKIEKDYAKLIVWLKEVSKYGNKDAGWADEVTQMLHLIDWAHLANDYNGGGGNNPPQDPPDWPGGP